jgi:ABC-type sugar transport system substrate-binding protein
MKVVYFLPDTTNPFWREVVAGIEKKGSPAGVSLEVVSCDHDASKQLAQLQAFGSHRPEAVFVSPVDANGSAPACKAAFGSGIPVIAIDNNIAGVTASVISGNMKGGVLAAVYIAEKKAGARVFHIKAEQHLQNVKLRSSAFVTEAARRGLSIVGSIQADSNRQTARAKLTELLQKGIRFDALFAENDNMAIGAAAAIEAARLSPYPIIVGYDGTAEARELIRSKRMDASVAQDPAMLGEKAVEVLMAARKGGPVQTVVTLLPHLVTQANPT